MKARTEFKLHIHKNSSFINEANWYYALSLLKQKKKEEAKIYLKASQLKISEPLLDELNK